MLELLLLVLGGALVAEGLFYALFPQAALRMLEVARQLPPGTLRIGGVVALAAGVGLFYLARTLGP